MSTMTGLSLKASRSRPRISSLLITYRPSIPNFTDFLGALPAKGHFQEGHKKGGGPNQDCAIKLDRILMQILAPFLVRLTVLLS